MLVAEEGCFQGRTDELFRRRRRFPTETMVRNRNLVDVQVTRTQERSLDAMKHCLRKEMGCEHIVWEVWAGFAFVVGTHWLVV